MLLIHQKKFLIKPRFTRFGTKSRPFRPTLVEKGYVQIDQKWSRDIAHSLYAKLSILTLTGCPVHWRGRWTSAHKMRVHIKLWCTFRSYCPYCTGQTNIGDVFCPLYTICYYRRQTTCCLLLIDGLQMSIIDICKFCKFCKHLQMTVY